MSDKTPHDAIDFIYNTAPKYAQAKAHRVYLEEFRKTKKALLMGQSDAKTAVEREQYAYAHLEYQELLKGLQAAVEQEETLKWHILAAEMRVEVWRSQEATNRRIDRATE